MGTKKSGTLREFGRIQKDGRISIPKPIRRNLGWEDGDQVMFEECEGRLFLENLSAKWRKEG